MNADRVPVESDTVELISQFDPGNRRDWLSLVKEIVAMANAAGGEIIIGADDDGELVGVEERVVKKLDPADIANHVDEFVKPDHVSVSVEVRDAQGTSKKLVAVKVHRAETPPVVFTKAGQYHDDPRGSQTVFERHSVVRRRGTKAEPATRNDYRDWVESAVEAERERWRGRLAVIANLGPEARIQVVDRPGYEPADEPSALLKYGIRLYGANPNRLLGGDDLLRLFLVRKSLNIGLAEAELLIQSSFRKRATLFFWLGASGFTADQVRDQLLKAVAASDRDKSDAGRSIVNVAALTQTDEDFERFRQMLADSGYKHFNEAAQIADDRAEMLRLISAERETAKHDKTNLTDMSVPALESAAEEVARSMLGSKSSGAKARRLAGIGLELFLRNHRNARREQ